jgi:predicted nuclease with TOPRIM domain
MNIDRLIIMTDGDEVGRKAAKVISDKLAGRFSLAVPEYPVGGTQLDSLSLDVLQPMLNTPGRMFECQITVTD